MKIGVHILWNVIPVCETFKISCLVGKLHTKGVLENILKDQSFRLVHWLSITLSLRKTSQESINLERKSYLDSEVYSRRLKVEIFSSRRWTNQTPWRRSGTENSHLDTGAPNPRRKSKGFSWRIRRVSSSTTSRLTSGCR